MQIKTRRHHTLYPTGQLQSKDKQQVSGGMEKPARSYGTGKMVLPFIAVFGCFS